MHTRLLHVLVLLVLLLGRTAQALTVTGVVQTAQSAQRTNVLLTFTPLNSPAQWSPGVFTTSESVYTRSGTNAAWSISLTPGFYGMKVGSNPRDVAVLAVTNGSASVAYTSISTNLPLYLYPVAPWNLTSGGGGGVTAHGDLTGLLNDDHTQYLTTNRALAYGNTQWITWSTTNTFAAWIAAQGLDNTNHAAAILQSGTNYTFALRTLGPIGTNAGAPFYMTTNAGGQIVGWANTNAFPAAAGSGDVTTAQLNTASNALVTLSRSQDTTTSNALVALAYSLGANGTNHAAAILQSATNYTDAAVANAARTNAVNTFTGNSNIFTKPLYAQGGVVGTTGRVDVLQITTGAGAGKVLTDVAGDGVLSLQTPSGGGSTTNIAELSFALLSLQSSATAINFGTNAQSITLTNATTFTSSALATGRVVSLRLVNTGDAKSVTFPAWKWLGFIPTSVSSNKIARVDLMSYGTSDADVVASFAEQDSLGSTARSMAFFQGILSNGNWAIIPNGVNTTNFAPVSKVRDYGNNYSTNTGLYLAPVVGRYLLSANVRFKDSSLLAGVGITIGTNSSVFAPGIWKWQNLTESPIDDDRNNIFLSRTTTLAAGAQVGLYAFSGNNNVTNIETEVSIELLEQE